MIYELVEQTLASTARQYADLSALFRDLAIAQGQILDPNATDYGNPDATQSTLEPGSFQEACFFEASNLLAQSPTIVATKPVSAMFSDEATLLTSSDTTVRVPIEAQFFGAFGSAASGLDSVEVTNCRAALSDLKAAIAAARQEIDEITTAEGQGFNLGRIGGSVENIASYPMLTSDVANIPSTGSGPGGGNNAPLKRIVDGALRDVLGRLPTTRDTKALQAVLTRSFDLTDFEGHVTFVWNPRMYAGETELAGGVTGAQYSLYSRAQIARDTALPILDRLGALLPDADPELVTASRAIVRSEFSEVVLELGREGGPRIARVDDLFESLLDRPVLLSTGGAVLGHLSFMQSVFGLEPDQVNTLDEETRVTSYLVLLDYVQSLRVSWETFRNNFFGRDLGTRLVRLSRALSVTSESVEEVYSAMDSVFVGPAERQVASFADGLGRQVLVEELLSWIVTFASREAPELVQEGGRRGVGAIVPTAVRLRDMVDLLLAALPSQPSLPDGLRHPRVAHPLREVRDYLLQVEQIATQVMA
jgi:hypothetical protein